SDGVLNSVPSIVEISVVNLNEAPTVRVEQPERTVDARSPVTLTAAAIDPEGDALTYQWAQEVGPTVTLGTQDNGASVTFIAPEVTENTDLTFIVKATDGKASSNVVPLKVTVRPAVAATEPRPNADGHTLGTTGCGCNTGFELLPLGALMLAGAALRPRRRRR
ncbi:MAG: PKD domain-containing protein, partial [Myxococcaceae bacterium]